MADIRNITGRMRWYHVAGLLLALAALGAFVWWLIERFRGGRTPHADKPDAADIK